MATIPIDPMIVKAAAGGLFGAAIMETEEDSVFEPLVGAAIGGITASQLDLSFQKMQDLKPVYEKQVDLTENVVEPPESVIQRRVSEFRKRLQSGALDDFIQSLVDDPDYAKELGVVGDLNNLDFDDDETVLALRKAFMAGETATADDIRSTKGVVLKASARNRLEFVPTDLDEWEQEYAKRYGNLVHFLKELGHSEEEAEQSARLMMKGTSFSDTMVLDRDKKQVKLKDNRSPINLETVGANGTLIRDDGKNIYASRRLNPFGQYLAKQVSNVGAPNFGESFGLHVDNLITSLGFDLDSPEADSIRFKAPTWFTQGMTGSELQTLAQASPTLSPFLDEINEAASAAHIFLQEESGMVRSGKIYKEELFNSPTTAMKDATYLTDIEKTFNIKGDGSIDLENAPKALKKLDASPNATGSTFELAQRALKKLAGVDNIRENTTQNEITLVNLHGNMNAGKAGMAPAERDNYKSRGYTVQVRERVGERKAFIDTLAQEAQRYASDELAPKGLDTHLVVRRLSVPQDEFNAKMYEASVPNPETGVTPSVSPLGDGHGLAKASDHKAYGFDIFKSTDVRLGRNEEVQISKHILDIMSKRDMYGVSHDSQSPKPLLDLARANPERRLKAGSIAKALSVAKVNTELLPLDAFSTQVLGLLDEDPLMSQREFQKRLSEWGKAYPGASTEVEKLLKDKKAMKKLDVETLRHYKQVAEAEFSQKLGAAIDFATERVHIPVFSNINYLLEAGKEEHELRGQLISKAQELYATNDRHIADDLMEWALKGRQDPDIVSTLQNRYTATLIPKAPKIDIPKHTILTNSIVSTMRKADLDAVKHAKQVLEHFGDDPKAIKKLNSNTLRNIVTNNNSKKFTFRVDKSLSEADAVRKVAALPKAHMEAIKKAIAILDADPSNQHAKNLRKGLEAWVEAGQHYTKRKEVYRQIHKTTNSQGVASDVINLLRKTGTVTNDELAEILKANAMKGAVPDVNMIDWDEFLDAKVRYDVVAENKLDFRAIGAISYDIDSAIKGYIGSRPVAINTTTGEATRLKGTAGANPRLIGVDLGWDSVTIHTQGTEQHRVGSSIKDFGGGSKQVSRFLPDTQFEKALTTAEELLDIEDDSLLRSGITKISEYGTSGQKDAAKFVSILNEVQTKGMDVGNFLRGVAMARKDENLLAQLTPEIKDLVQSMPDYDPSLYEELAPKINAHIKSPSQQNNRNVMWAMAQIMNSVTEGKSTNNAVLGVAYGVAAEASNAASVIVDKADDLNFRHSSNAAVRMRRVLGNMMPESLPEFETIFMMKPENRPQAFQDLFNEVLPEIRKKGYEISSRFSQANVAETVLDGVFTDETIAAYKTAYTTQNVDYMVSQIRPDATTLSGSGGDSKSMSHLAVNAYMNSGLPAEHLDYFAQLDPRSKYDLQAFMLTTQARNKDVATMNELISSKFDDNAAKIQAFLSSDVTKGPDQLKHFLDINPENADGRYSKNGFAMFSLDGVNSPTGIKQIPLYLADTNYGGSTYTQQGDKISSRLNNAHWNVIQAYYNTLDPSKAYMLENTTAPDGSVIKGTKALLEDSLQELSGLYDEMFKSENAWAKQIFSRTATASMFGKVVPTSNKHLTDIASDRSKEGRLVLGVSEERARRLISQALDEDIDITTFRKNHLTPEGKIVMAGEKDLAAISWREPTYSLLPAEVYVDPGIRDYEISVDPVSKLLAKRMLGDMDEDNIYVAFGSQRGEQLAEFAAQAEEADRANKVVTALAENIGIKGGDNGPAFNAVQAMRELREANPDASREELKQLFDKRMANYREEAMRKGALRKVLTPFNTNMVVNALNKVETNAETPLAHKLSAVLLANYMVEDVIKATHLRTDSGAGKTLNDLLSSYQQYQKLLSGKGNSEQLSKVHKKWIDSVDAAIDIMTEKVRANLDTMAPDVKQAHQEALDAGKKLLMDAFESPNSQYAKSVMEVTSQIRSLKDPTDMEAMRRIITNAHNSQYLGLTDGQIDHKRSKENTSTALKSTLIENVKRNKGKLALGAAALGAASFFMRDDPDFYAQNADYYDPEEMQGLTLAGNTALNTDVSDLLQGLGTQANVYATQGVDPMRLANNAFNVYGSYQNSVDTLHQDAQRAIFGNSVSSVRIDRTYDPY